MFANVLASASNKAGLAEFLKPFANAGARVVSTGGTSQYLRNAGLSVVEVAEQTGFPEVMDGRVRTLHPRVHMPLLARGWDDRDLELLREHKLQLFDLVVVNLYPFEEALASALHGVSRELVDEIDIGGPALLRAASKNFERIAVVCEPDDYAWILARHQEGGTLSLDDRRKLAAKAFAHVSRYDALIARTLDADGAAALSLSGTPVAPLRYGENPHQPAWWMKRAGVAEGLHQAEILHGKALSYNNILDLEAATTVCRDFAGPAVVAIKHNNPCGAGVSDTEGSALQALERALRADPTSVFGGIVASNRALDGDCARAAAKIFLECVIAPDFSAEALEILKKKKDLRLLRWPALSIASPAARALEFRSIQGGFLAQQSDAVSDSASWKIIGETPSRETMADLELAWKICARLKSNAIAIALGGRTVGLGMGQVNRVEAVEQAIARMRKHAPEIAGNASFAPVLASDAFFPFPDSIELAAQAGIRFVVQPGGSIRDQEVIARARELGITMILTGVRHFKH